MRAIKRRYLNVAGVAILACLALVCITLALITFVPSIREQVALSYCSGLKLDQKTACIFNVIGDELHRGGVVAAEATFKMAYEQFPDFADSGCHTWAHRVGDMTYYELYLGDESLDKIDFPQDTTACGYGFFHGFLEHDIQDHPTIPFITQTCDYLTKRLGATMGDIELTCYHAGGHGLELAQSEKVTKAQWGNVAAFADVPAAECVSLPDANATDVEQCYEGIFNIIVNYMTDNNYGFSYDNAHPFSVCFEQRAAIQYACIYEMAQKLPSASNSNAANMVKLVSVIPDMQQRLYAFEVGMAGIIQDTIAQDDYSVAYAQCTPLQEPYYSSCVSSIAWALFEHGDPQDEYKVALRFCAEPSVADRGADQVCYRRVWDELRRFYAPERAALICDAFPAAYRSVCKPVSTVSTST